MTTTYNGGNLLCDKCHAHLRVALPISTLALGFVIEAFDARHDDEYSTCGDPIGLVDLMVERAAALWESGDAWQECDDVVRFMQSFAEIVRRELRP